MRAAPDRIVLVIGGSRGVGAAVAPQLAEAGTHVIVNYGSSAARAESVATDVRAAGGSASTLAADLGDSAGTIAMMKQIATRFGRLDTLVLNASGHVEPGTDPRCASRLNREAQRRIAQLAVPLMPAGGRIVLATSHQAHFFPHKAVPKGYAALAASQRAGETALYTMRSQFTRAGVDFTVVSGNIIDETVTDCATAIVHAVRAPSAPAIVYVGGAHYLMTA